jgi:hypothetical protein
MQMRDGCAGRMIGRGAVGLRTHKIDDRNGSRLAKIQPERHRKKHDMRPTRYRRPLPPAAGRGIRGHRPMDSSHSSNGLADQEGTAGTFEPSRIWNLARW